MRPITAEELLRQAREESAREGALAAAYTGPPMPFVHNGNNREAAMPWRSHVEIAGMVRMLMRDDISHEMIVCAARDRILHLAQENERLRAVELHTGHNDKQVFFYEREFYVLSNFSAFTLMWPPQWGDARHRFDTSEAAYHWEKFISDSPGVAHLIRTAPSAHEAYKIAEKYRSAVRHDWNDIKLDVMLRICRAKAEQHEYVRRKLLESGDRELIENSWRDDFWGWGPNKDGQNHLGKIWMQVRAELRTDAVGDFSQGKQP